jgi:hypothetical protein
MSQPVSGTTTSTSVQGVSGVPTKKEEAKVVTPQATATLATPDVYGMFVGIFMLFLTVVVLFTTGSILAVLVLWALIALIITVLFYYGFIDLERILGVKKEVKVEKKPEPAANVVPAGPMIGSEVFHIRQNQFTYDEAPAVCAAYGAELATLEQIIEAYNAGAEWCGYGWSAGGMALYPTQKRTWEELQREVDPGKRTACGRPGVNGGYFDPSLKFGVNCFGFKPTGEFTPPAPLPGTDRQKFDDMVNRFKEMLKSFKLSPFSRREWSGYDSTPAGQVSGAVQAGRKIVEGFSSMSSYGTQFQQDLGRLEEPFDNADPETIEMLETGSRNYSAGGPYGLRGDIGPRGDLGPTGPKGDVGAQGIQGIQGLQGIQGERGEKGDVGGIGPTGPQGRQGEVGGLGPTGPKGDRGADGNVSRVEGPTGKQGPTGKYGHTGPTGRDGPTGRQGSTGPAGRDGSPGATGPKGDAGTLPASYSTQLNQLTTDINNLKRNAVQLNTPFRIIDGNNQWLSKSGGGGKGAWEVLRAQAV